MNNEQMDRHYALKVHLHNARARALEHCYASSDAAGLPWTQEGWDSITESNIIHDLQNLGLIPKELPEIPIVDRDDMEQIHRYWAYDDGDDYEDSLGV